MRQNDNFLRKHWFLHIIKLLLNEDRAIMKPEESTTTPMTTATAAPSAAHVDTSPKSYLAMMVLAFFAAPMGLARAYRGEKSGWVRFWIYIASQVLMIVPFVNFLAIIALLVLTIWGIVDIFLLYNTRTDAAGVPYYTTPRDDRIARALRTATIVLLAISGVLIVLGIMFAGFFLSTFQNGLNNYNTSSPSSSQYRSSFN